MPSSPQRNEDFDVVKYFLKLLDDDRDLSSGIAAIKTLLMILEKKQLGTVYILRNTVAAMRNTDLSIAAVVSGGELFCRFITLSLDDRVQKFITDGCRVLTHSRSRVVLKTLLTAAKANKQFHVFVMQGCPDNLGEQIIAELERAGIDCTMILDSDTGCVMESVDFVMVVAVAVVESGGIIIVLQWVYLCAREMKTPFYVLSESFKFTRLYPLNQRENISTLASI